MWASQQTEQRDVAVSWWVQYFVTIHWLRYRTAVTMQSIRPLIRARRAQPWWLTARQTINPASMAGDTLFVYGTAVFSAEWWSCHRMSAFSRTPSLPLLFLLATALAGKVKQSVASVCFLSTLSF